MSRQTLLILFSVLSFIRCCLAEVVTTEVSMATTTPGDKMPSEDELPWIEWTVSQIVLPPVIRETSIEGPSSAPPAVFPVKRKIQIQ